MSKIPPGDVNPSTLDELILSADVPLIFTGTTDCLGLPKHGVRVLKVRGAAETWFQGPLDMAGCSEHGHFPNLEAHQLFRACHFQKAICSSNLHTV